MYQKYVFLSTIYKRILFFFDYLNNWSLGGTEKKMYIVIII